MVFLFRDKSFSNIFFLLVLLVAVHSNLLFKPVMVSFTNTGFISIFLKNFILPLNNSFKAIIYLVIVLTQALRLNLILNNSKMFPQQNFTVAMSYILLSGFLVEWCSISSGLITNFLFLWLYVKLSALPNHPNPKNLIFSIGLIASVTLLAYQYSFAIIPIVIFALAVVRPFRITEWIVLLFGFILPYYLLSAYLFLTNQLHEILLYLPKPSLQIPDIKNPIHFFVNLSILFILIIAGLIYNRNMVNRLVIHLRKNWSILIIMLIITLPTPLFFKNATLASTSIAFIPLAAIIANPFSVAKRLLFPNLLFWLSIFAVGYTWFVLVKN